jgi:hypothetical protein
MTLLAVARAEPGWPQRDRHHRSAAVLVAALGRCSGGCWPASPKVALAGVAASGGSTRSGSGLAPPRPTGWQQGRQPDGRPRGRHPGPSRRTRPQPSTRWASHPMAGRAMLGSGHLCRWRVASGRAPSDRASLGLSVARDHRSWRTRAMRIEPAALATSIGSLNHPGRPRGLPRGPPAGGGGGQAAVPG